MNSRKEFIEKIIKKSNESIFYIPIKEPNELASILFDKKQDEYFVKNEFIKSSVFKKFLDSNEIKINLKDIDLSFIKYELDFYLLEESLISFDFKINLNHIYDLINEKIESKTIIYRIEDIDGKGLYSGFNPTFNQNINLAPIEDKDLSVLFSTTFSNDYDLISLYYKNWIFGFKNKEDIDIWLQNTNKEKLINKDFYISEYEIDNNYIVNGENQIAFKKREANLIQQYHVKNFFNIDKQKIRSKVKI